MTMACKLCKFWDKDTEKDLNKRIRGPVIRVCTKPEMLYKSIEENEAETDRLQGTENLIVYDVLLEHRDLKMFVQDAEEYAASLYTREDFFCAHFEEMLA